MSGDITGVAEAAWGIWQEGGASKEVWAVIDIMPPIRMTALAAWAMMVFSPTQVSDLGV